jgi:hypothetical protein
MLQSGLGPGPGGMMQAGMMGGPHAPMGYGAPYGMYGMDPAALYGGYPSMMGMVRANTQTTKSYGLMGSLQTAPE